MGLFQNERASKIDNKMKDYKRLEREALNNDKGVASLLSAVFEQALNDLEHGNSNQYNSAVAFVKSDYFKRMKALKENLETGA